ncbi:MAG: hypothetical protein HKN59_04395, partial [Gammaproteobacteria bacterium]|nr:hypothetical protein [Gammaproteobacteria bacterium]
IACVDGFRPAVEGTKVSDCDPSTVVIVEVCDLSLDKMCFVTPLPPSSNFACDKPIDSLTMIWTGNNTVWVRAWKGSVGSTSLGVKSVGPDEEVTFTGFAGSPNDVFWEVFSDAGLTNKIGESKFHLSCSDDDMDGPEDCGKLQGNGKDNDSSLLNDWLLEGIVDAQGTLDCTVDTTPVFAEACEFTGEPLPSCENGEKPDTLTWRYDGGTNGDGNCADSTFPDIGHDDFECAGSVDTSQSITVEDDDGNIYVVNPGHEFTVNRDAIGSMSLSNGGGTQTMVFHASCSQPLEALATAGALTLVALDDRRADREVQYAYTVTNNSTGAVSNIDVTDDKLGDIGSIASLDGNGASMTLYAQAFITATTTNTAMAIGDLVNADDCVAPNDTVTVTVNEPPKSCEANGKPTALEFTLGSGLCSDMDNGQGDKAKCEGDGALADISTVVMTKDENKFDVSLSGDSFVIAYNNPPGDKMPSTIKFRVTDGNGVEHDYEVHTSCSQPLAEGDVIGGLEITDFVPEF